MALIIVTGPPAAGKTTYVAEHAKPGDIRIDLDHIANTLAGESVDNHEHAPHIFAVAKAARQAAIDAAIKQDRDVWLIHTKPTAKQLDDYQALGATVHEIDPGKDVVMKRCKQERPKGSLIAAANGTTTNRQRRRARMSAATGTNTSGNAANSWLSLKTAHHAQNAANQCTKPQERTSTVRHSKPTTAQVAP